MVLERKYIKNQPLRRPQAAEKGGALIIIFVMIGLFAALSYIFSSGTRTGIQQISGEKAQLAAAEILDYASKVKRAVQQLQINGCSDTEVSFENSIGPIDYTNANSPTDNSCHVFHPSGGNLLFKMNDPNFLASNATFSDPRFSSGYQHEGVGTIDNELTMKVTWLKREICIAINNLLNIDNPSGEPPVEENDSASLQFTGTYGGTVADTIGDDGTGLDGKIAFCRHQSSSDTYQFNQVLIVR